MSDARSNRVVEVLPQLVPPLEEYLARHPRRADSNAPFWMGRRQGGTYMTDWSPISRGTIAMHTDEQRALLNKHHGPIDEIRPFDPERRWDPMVFTKHVWRRAVGMARLDRASSVGLRAAEPMLVVRDENERQWDSDYPLSQRLTRDPDDPKFVTPDARPATHCGVDNADGRCAVDSRLSATRPLVRRNHGQGLRGFAKINCRVGHAAGERLVRHAAGRDRSERDEYSLAQYG